jgi:hypothetical protein
MPSRRTSGQIKRHNHPVHNSTPANATALTMSGTIDREKKSQTAAIKLTAAEHQKTGSSHMCVPPSDKGQASSCLCHTVRRESITIESFPVSSSAASEAAPTAIGKAKAAAALTIR